jgi:hypothetical protein
MNPVVPLWSDAVIFNMAIHVYKRSATLISQIIQPERPLKLFKKAFAHDTHSAHLQAIKKNLLMLHLFSLNVGYVGHSKVF